MDSLVASAARALAAGDPLGALKRVALRDDPPALALRGIAMVQLGDYDRARKLPRRAARGFGPHASALACALGSSQRTDPGGGPIPRRYPLYRIGDAPRASVSRAVLSDSGPLACFSPSSSS